MNVFVDSEYLDFCYLVDTSDNYIVLTDTPSVSGSWDSPSSIDIIYKYFYPSTVTIESTRSFRTSEVFNRVGVSDSFYDRADCPSLMLCIYSCIFFILFLINGLTRFIHRGGIIFGK